MKRAEHWFCRGSAVAGFLLIMVLSGGCTTTKQYATLAEAGSAYTGAVAALADRASALEVESSSYQLLNERRVLSTRYKDKALRDTLTTHLSAAETSDYRAIQKNRRIKDVAMSLQAYFDGLKAMATSSAPSDIGKKTGNLVSKLNIALMKSGNSIPDSDTALVSPALTHMTEAVLKKELTGRRKTILNALAVIRELDEGLERTSSGYGAEVDKSFKFMLVKLPFTDSRREELMQLGGMDLWLQERRKLMLSSSSADQAKAMIDASRKSYDAFKETFNKMTTGNAEVSMDDLGKTVDELKAFNTFVKNL
jgi:hypothetical protein